MTYIMIILTHSMITIIITVTFIIAMVMTILPNTVGRSFSRKDGFRTVINHRFFINPNVYSNSLISEMYIHLQKKP